MKQTRQAVRAIKQSIFLDVYDSNPQTWDNELIVLPPSQLLMTFDGIIHGLWPLYYEKDCTILSEVLSDKAPIIILI